MNDYARFLAKVIRDSGELIIEAMMVESEPVYHIQSLHDENWKDDMVDELKAIEKKHT